jgi:transcriptional regulator with XRE-family HTH domain
MTGDEMRDLRVKAGLRQAQIAAKLDLSVPYIGMLERGEREIQSHVETAIRDALSNIPRTGLFVPDAKQEKEARDALVVALGKMPDLSMNGFTYSRSHNDPFERMRSHVESQAALFSEDGLAQIATSIAWIRAVKVVKEAKCGSYGAKHVAERWGSKNGYSSYVANGSVLVASIYLKVPVKRQEDSPNAQLGLDPDPLPDPKKGTFAAWLFTQVDISGFVGDLATDARHDRGFPLDTSSGPKLRAYLRSKNAHEGAFEALNEALLTWRSNKTG